MHKAIREFYAHPSRLTAASRYAERLAELPNSVSELVRIVQGLSIYDVVAADFYGVTLAEERRNEIHLRTFAKMIERVLAYDDRPLSMVRAADKRLACRCHNFTRFLVALLRAKGIPARSRCGFGAYFRAGSYEDHWVCEYWNAPEARWVLVDAQLDDVWRAKLRIDFDVLDVPRGRFVVASDAWRLCRSGRADPAAFGIGFVNLYGLWFVAGNLIRDVAALNKVEMLPWDVWGAMPAPHEPLNGDQLAFYDTLAALTHEPDSSFAELRHLYENDDRVRVPSTVFNALRNVPESVAA